MRGQVVMKRSLVMIILLLLCMVCGVISSPPEDVVKCASENTNCIVTNYIGTFPDRSTCQAGEVKYPTTEQELISIIAEATKNKRKMKATTRYSHSIPKLVCPDGKDGLLISTNKLDKTVKLDVDAKTITVESGATLRQIIDDAANNGLALPYAPYWWGVTIGGLMGTGAHGSTLTGKGSAVHDYVAQLRIVSPAGPQDGYAKVRVLTQSDPDLNAAKVSLGVLGVISQVTLKLEPMFKRSIQYDLRDDNGLGDELTSFGRQYEFADVIWYPSSKQAIYRNDKRVPISAEGNGAYDFFPFRPSLSAVLGFSRHAEETQETIRDANGKCLLARGIKLALIAVGFGLVNNGVFLGYPVIGYSNKMQSSGTCLDSPNDHLITACPWDSRIKGEFFHQTAFSIPLSSVKGFVEDVQTLVQMVPDSLCGVEIMNGILMRYVTASTAYLGKTGDAVDFDITYYRAKDPLAPRLFEDVIEEIEQMGLFKYGGSPHWGKNRNVAFVGAINKYPNADKFMKVKQEYDSQGLFSSEWTDQVLGLKQGITIDRDGCALEGLCICSQDSHCAPSKGYYCKEGRVYKEARVCRFYQDDDDDDDDDKKTQPSNHVQDEF